MAARARSDAPDSQPRKRRSDAYVGLLALALLAQITGAIFLYMDYSSYPSAVPPKVAGAPSAGPATPPPPPPGGQPGMP